MGTIVQSYQGTSIGKNELQQILAFVFLCSGFRFRKGVLYQPRLGHISATWLGKEGPLDEYSSVHSIRTHQGTGKDFRPEFKGREKTERMNYYS